MTLVGKELLQHLKEVAGTSVPQLRQKIVGFENYFLRPIATRRESQDPRDVECLTSWRNRYVRSFLTQFTATEERTSRWLADAMHADNSCILFMIENAEGERVGYMGIAFIDWNSLYGEPDAIVKGGATPKGMMSAALRTLLRWAKEQLCLKVIVVRVLSNNPALMFYRKLGFKETKRVPLKRVVTDDLVSWIEDDMLRSSELYLVHHVWIGHEN